MVYIGTHSLYSWSHLSGWCWHEMHRTTYQVHPNVLGIGLLEYYIASLTPRAYELPEERQGASDYHLHLVQEFAFLWYTDWLNSELFTHMCMHALISIIWFYTLPVVQCVISFCYYASSIPIIRDYHNFNDTPCMGQVQLYATCIIILMGLSKLILHNRLSVVQAWWLFFVLHCFIFH